MAYDFGVRCTEVSDRRLFGTGMGVESCKCIFIIHF